jgi:hypothetical protein
MAIKTMTVETPSNNMYTVGWHELTISKATSGTWNDKDIIDVQFEGYPVTFDLRFYATFNKETNEEFALARLYKYANAGIVSVLQDPTGKKPMIQYDDDPKGLVGKTINVYLYKDGKYHRAANRIAPVTQKGEHLSFNDSDVEAIKKSCMKGIEIIIAKAESKAVINGSSNSSTATTNEDMPF